MAVLCLLLLSVVCGIVCVYMVGCEAVAWGWLVLLLLLSVVVVRSVAISMCMHDGWMDGWMEWVQQECVLLAATPPQQPAPASQPFDPYRACDSTLR